MKTFALLIAILISSLDVVYAYPIVMLANGLMETLTVLVETLG